MHTLPPDRGEDIATAYRECHDLLGYLATYRFRVAEEDVPDLIHQVFVAFIRNHSKIRDARTWLVGAMYMQCRQYWRARGRDDIFADLDDSIELPSIAADASTRVDVGRVLRRLPRRCRELLHLRFFEERSSEEIAQRYATTIDYARKLVHRCVASARTLFLQHSGKSS